MTDAEGVGLLLHGHSHGDIQHNFGTALKIVQRLGGLALAIDQAAAYIRYRHISLDELGEFITMYDQQREQILSYTPAPFWEYCTVQIHGEEDRNKAINAFTTWEMSLEQLDRDKSIDKNEVTRFLMVSAFFNPVRIEEWLFRTRWENDRTQWLHVLGVIDDHTNSQEDRNNSNEDEQNRSLRSYASKRKNDVNITSPKERRK